MDKILLSNLGFYGYHGVLKEENFLAGLSDDINKSVSYAEVYNVVKDITENKQFNLLEALAENIAEEVLNKFILINGVMVRVRKPEAPVNGIYDYFGVEIRRTRDE